MHAGLYSVFALARIQEITFEEILLKHVQYIKIMVQMHAAHVVAPAQKQESWQIVCLCIGFELSGHDSRE